MGKRFLVMLIMASQLVTNGSLGSLTDGSVQNEQLFEELELECSKVVCINNQDENVVSELESKREEFDAFLKKEGVIVVYGNDKFENSKIENALGMKVSEVHLEEDTDVEVVTLYYQKDNIIATYEINLADVKESNKANIVNETINDIRNQPDAVTVATSTEEMELIAYKTYNYIYEPKGQLRVVYQVYTLQDEQELDFYIVKAQVTGIPGADMGGAYETQYEGENMSVSIETPTSSMSHIKSGPPDTEDKTQTTVSLQGTFDIINKQASVSGGLSWTLDTNNIKIDKKPNYPDVEWDLEILGQAQKHEYVFTPAVSYHCPQAKSSVTFNTYASYTLDSILTFEDTIELEKTFTCTP